MHPNASHRVFWLSWVAYSLFNVARKPQSISKQSMLSELDMSEVDLGMIDSSFLISYTIGQFLVGPMADRVGANYIVGIGLIGSCVLLFV